MTAERRMAAALLGMVAGIALFPHSAAAQQFSAEIVKVDAQGEPLGKPGKLYVADGKVRIETPDLPDGFFLVDADRGTAYFVRPARREFMEARRSSRLPEIFVPVDPGEPCRAWRVAAERAGAAADWSCRAVAADGAPGRELATFAVSAPGSQGDRRSVDPALRFPVKVASADGTAIELRDLRPAPQPADLFQIPAGYRLFDPARLIDRIKQSDVWVEPPK
jgi:hypothetical protein